MRVLLSAAFLTLFVAGGAAAQSLDELSEAQSATLGLFQKGCLEHPTDRETWATAQQALNKAEIQDADAAASLAQKLGYPESDRVKNIWAIFNHYIVMYDLENFGCLVTSDQYFEPETAEQFLSVIERDQERASSKEVTVTSDVSNDGRTRMSLLTFEHKKGRISPYIVMRTYSAPENPEISTLLYFFRTKKDIEIDDLR